jgi:hypothetical protein
MSVPLETISEDCSVIAFYGIKPSAKAAQTFYSTIVGWFYDLEWPADKVGVFAPGHPGKLVSFTDANATIQKTGFEGEMVIEIVSTVPWAEVWGRDYLLRASYDGRSQSLDAAVVARSSFATLSATSMLPIARTLAQALDPEYGIGYVREHQLGPELYCSGISMGLGLTGLDDEEALNISHWTDGIEGKVWRQGLLRDVYPWNFLTSTQLAKLIKGASLEDWIHQDARHGTLNVLCDGIHLWEVAEPILPEVRQALQQAEAIFDWRKYSKEEST